MSLFPKPEKPKPPPMAAQKAEPSVLRAGEDVNSGYQSLISTGPQGLTKKARTSPRTLIGGAA